MSELVQIRQRIKAIETIQKITHAMRLIAMSAHSRLKKKEAGLAQYTAAINALFHTMRTTNPTWTNTRLQPLPSCQTNILVIIVGSQKGLCGNFNTQLLTFFTHHMARHPESTFDIVTVGKKTSDLLHRQYPKLSVKTEYTVFNLREIFSIAQALTHMITQAQEPYTSVLLFSNELKGFFIQKPTVCQLIPFIPSTGHTRSMTENYLYQQDPHQLIDLLAYQSLESRIQELLFTSLHAEQAARFISMDGATRNALTLLETNKLLYNKLRQAKITKELTELTASY